jgi:hypothetical protein
MMAMGFTSEDARGLAANGLSLEPASASRRRGAPLQHNDDPPGE